MSETQCDVIVVGAGLSGLQAAYDIQQAGLSCIVLEARDRVGGKTWSVPLANGKGNVDIGAAWINDTNQSHVYALTKRFGIELLEQNVDGDCIFQDKDGATHAFPYGTSPKVLLRKPERKLEFRLTGSSSRKLKSRISKGFGISSMISQSLMARKQAAQKTMIRCHWSNSLSAKELPRKQLIWCVFGLG